jgi:hypothetical protein
MEGLSEEAARVLAYLHMHPEALAEGADEILDAVAAELDLPYHEVSRIVGELAAQGYIGMEDGVLCARFEPKAADLPPPVAPEKLAFFVSRAPRVRSRGSRRPRGGRPPQTPRR